eukprot:GILK01007043.1.p1 GENE.GILK01007043.1~~GILK01007043.1.p1  ORF type:complete len:780 (-),score=125.89 GILK01007043.1:96-2435(-)
MGGCISKCGRPKTGRSRVGRRVVCPVCGMVFNSRITFDGLNTHVDQCLSNTHEARVSLESRAESLRVRQENRTAEQPRWVRRVDSDGYLRWVRNDSTAPPPTVEEEKDDTEGNNGGQNSITDIIDALMSPVASADSTTVEPPQRNGQRWVQRTVADGTVEWVPVGRAGASPVSITDVPPTQPAGRRSQRWVRRTMDDGTVEWVPVAGSATGSGVGSGVVESRPEQALVGRGLDASTNQQRDVIDIILDSLSSVTSDGDNMSTVTAATPAGTPGGTSPRNSISNTLSTRRTTSGQLADNSRTRRRPSATLRRSNDSGSSLASDRSASLASTPLHLRRNVSTETNRGGVEREWVSRWGADGALHLVQDSSEQMLGDGENPVPDVFVANQDFEGAIALPFAQKQKWFYRHLEQLRIPWEDGSVRIEIERSNLLTSAFNAFAKLKRRDFHKEFKFVFLGEPGLDAGGLSREFFTLIVEQLFDRATGLFEFSDVDNCTCQINPSTPVTDLHLQYFKFCGKVLAKALFDRHLVKAHLCRPLYKLILGLPVLLEDLQFLDTQLYQSLLFMKENSIEGIFFETFSVKREVLDKEEIIDLKPNGRDIVVTDANKDEYIKLLFHWRVRGRIERQLLMFLEGLFDVIPAHLCSVFDFQELELLCCGLPQIDVDDWQKNTNYKGVFHADHPVIKWFWQVVHSFTQEERARLLQFATGTSLVPVRGFAALESNRGSTALFTIESVPFESDRPYLRAHTCFNRVDLPIYSSKSELEKYVSLAIQMEIIGFGLE